MEKIRLVATVTVFLLIILVSSIIFLSTPEPQSITTPIYSYTVQQTFPHSTNSFTEGLTFDENYLLESTGLTGASSLKKISLETGEIVQSIELNSNYFGEGITVVNGTIIQLTWQNQVAFVYDKENFTLIKQFTYNMAGWGLTFDGQNLIMSNGSPNLYFLNPETFKVTGQITVKDGNLPIDQLNELEYVNGTIYANIWQQNKIAQINPQDGQILAWIDLTGLYTSADSINCLNGIAYNPQNGALIVTGKNWPSLYQIQIVPNI
ncbi:MAG: glutaminyl-peptide cyclotransferase [Candidatus Bathyarchaeota archaeon]|nr:glutaminyl-peptide cyclotransferase [Candidatus Bathyarchaeota archaeon]